MIRHRMAIQRQMAREREAAEQQAKLEAKEDTGPAGLELMGERNERRRAPAKRKPKRKK